jgi:alkanesulfonate monooxygenase SsuD/methylene tetrahydromethanopterin reductase-like flavin-dependent oxidoreductase (luciferase family)
MDFGIFHNGSTNVPMKRASSGIVVPDATVEEIHADNQQVLKDQIRHGVLADELGLDRAFFTEHHFELTGAEFSANPLQAQMAVAARTDDVKLCQMGNILPWHDPVRLAEQTAALDVYSDGRAEIGLGRGYQPREAEVLGAMYWGGTCMNDEKNRRVFEEKYDILLKAWTEDFLSYNGQFHHIPPVYTKHHHTQDHAYLADEASEYAVDDVFDWDEEGDIYSEGASRILLSTNSTVEKVPVFPQPLQDPYPQLWMPVVSPRSVSWAARNAVNGVITLGPKSRIEPVVDTYYEAAEAAGWPDRDPELDGEPFAYGWDEKRQRGLGFYRLLFNTDVADEETFERFKLGAEAIWDHLAASYSAELLLDLSDEEVETLRSRQDLDEDQHVRADFEMLEAKSIAITGSSEEIADRIAGIKEDVGFTDLNLVGYFEVPGLTGEEADEQLRAFAERVVPYLEEEFPGA